MNHEETCIECGGKIIYTSSGGTCTLCGQPDTIHSTQTDQNAKVSEIAETMAREAFPHSFALIDADPITFKAAYEHNISQFLEEARKKVNEEQLPDPNAAYNAKVLYVAEILARTPYNPEKWQGIEHFGQMVKERLIEAKMEEARAMVAEMANYYRLGVLSGRERNKKWAAIDTELIERGLIPNNKIENNAR